MSKPSREVAAALRKVPPIVRQHLKDQCDGDWDRVSVDGKGSFHVANSARAAMDTYAQRLAAMSTGPAPPAPVPEERKPESRQQDHPAPVPAPAATPAPATKAPSRSVVRRKLRTVVDPKALVALVSGPEHVEEEAPRSEVNIVSAPARPRVEQTKFLEADLTRHTLDIDSIALTRSANSLRDKFQHGVPGNIRPSYKDEVLEVWAVTVDMMEGTLRHPERVEIRPETYDETKRYPVLGFHRGDMVVILGLKYPATPAVIAAYASAKLMHDTHRVGHTGGGGAKAKAGLPKTAREVIKTLKDRGCKIEVDELSDKPVEVSYKGESLGKISTASNTPRATAEGDYQRTIRKMHALDRREGVSA